MEWITDVLSFATSGTIGQVVTLVPGVVGLFGGGAAIVAGILPRKETKAVSKLIMGVICKFTSRKAELMTGRIITTVIDCGEGAREAIEEAGEDKDES